ncbi:MAG: hypothetical protein JO041_02955 [Acidobacteria bacterium]|nr:hypothetical protein [Acidobacteriota bacterium]
MRTLRSLFGLALLAGLVYATYKAVPVYLSAFEFEDAIKEEARLGAYSKRSEEQIHDVLMKKASELQIPLEPTHLIVSRSGDDLNISADYAIPLDVPNLPLSLKFHPSSSGHRLRAVGL